MKKIFFTISFLFSFFLVSFSAFGVSTNIVFSEQRPDPVSPGAIVEVAFDISSQSDLSDAKITLIENKYFLVVDKSSTKYLGSISNTRVKFRIKVAENTPIGANEIKVKLSSIQGEVEQVFDIEIKEKSPILIIKSLEVNRISPGSSQPMKITLENSNAENLRNVEVLLNFAQIEESPLSLKNGGSQLFTELIKANSDHIFNVEVLASPLASSKPYFIPIQLNYQNLNGEKFSFDTHISVQVYADPFLSLRIDKQDFYTKGKNKITLAVANPSQSTLKGVEIEILEDENYNVITGGYNYIGDLNVDDFQTLQTDIFVNNENTELKIKVSFSDSYNQKISKIYNLPLSLYSEKKAGEIGVSTNSQSSSFSFKSFIVWIIIFLIGFFVVGVTKRHFNF